MKERKPRCSAYTITIPLLITVAIAVLALAVSVHSWEQVVTSKKLGDEEAKTNGDAARKKRQAEETKDPESFATGAGAADPSQKDTRPASATESADAAAAAAPAPESDAGSRSAAEPADPPPAAEAEPPSAPAESKASRAPAAAVASAPGAAADNSSGAGLLISDAEFEAESPQDPFSIQKWTQFKMRAKHIQDALLNLTSNLINSQQSYSSDSNGSAGVSVAELGPILQSLSEFFAPLDEELLDVIPYTLINPAVGLYTMQLLNSLATTKPTSLRDRTRLKWVEVNAVAVTTHYSFERIFRLLSQDGDWADAREALTIEYPSWIEEVNANDTEGHKLMRVGAIIDRIHGQFDVLGEKYQLLRGLEKLLRKKLKDLNPEKTDLNLYCYGNNDYIMVYDVPDLLTDAALYLVMADMKYFVIQLLNVIASALADSSSWTASYDQLKQNLTARIEKKIAIGEPVQAPEPPTASGPTLFPCDPRPTATENDTKLCVSSPLSPEVHIIDNVPTLVEGNTPAQLDPKTKHPLYANGTRVPGIEVYRQFKSVDGTPIASTASMPITTSEDGTKVVDGNGTVIEGATVVFVYIPYDDLPRGDGNTIPGYSKVEWGKFQCDISPNATRPEIPNESPFGPEPPSAVGVGVAEGPPVKEGEGPPPKEGYKDDRTPDFGENVAQFSLAYSGYIEAELVLSQGHSCAGTCMDYHSGHGSQTSGVMSSAERCDAYRESMCKPRGTECLAKSKCLGKARRCVRTAPVVEICEAKTKTGTEATRLYDWIKLSDGRLITATTTTADESGLGAKHKTAGGNETAAPFCGNPVQTAAERWEMDFGVILSAPEYCEVCMCVCDHPMAPEGHHVFGLHPIVAKEGYVITAVRFQQNGNSMQLNVEEAKWVGNGHVDAATLEWQKVQEIDKLSKDESWAKLGSNGFTKMNLDSVFVAANEVVTGIRVVLVGDALRVQVQGTPVQDDGTLAAAPSEWKGLDNSTSRREVDLTHAESSIKQKGPSQPQYHDPNTGVNVNGTGTGVSTEPAGFYVRFDASSLMKDGGQSVIPFFDLQPSHHHFAHRKALQGVGISYKAKQGYGGFLVPGVSLYKKYF